MRNYYFDNLKVILIFLVVLGHLIEPLITEEFYRTIYIIIYSFHMPLFIFVTGYFAKANNKGIKKLWMLLFKYEIIYALVSFLAFIIFQPKLALGTSEPFWQLLMQPIWLLWYLLSLIWWRYMLIGIKRFKWLIFIIAAMIISFTFIDFNFRILSIGRTLTFFPFFYLGYITKERQFDINRFREHRKSLLIVSIAIVTYWTYSISTVEITDLYGATSLITRLDIFAILKLKLLLYCIALYTGLIFMSFVSNRKESYSDIGASTLAIYIYHGLIIIILKAIGVFELLSTIPISISFVLILLFSLFLVKYLPKIKV